ncbi:SDR family oxidoreductase [Millisia brevis]|uniref:SDR family oxidoreductase n=1 Tax=Millisia brevis TaxID=264148 RepID=UPI00082A6390|nr:SDR family oxidoreductase [Millisia brevis]
MTTYLFTGATGFLGRHVLARLLDADPSAKVYALVRPGSLDRFAALVDALDAADRVHALPGDLTAPGLGIADGAIPPADHVVHLGAIYDLTVGDEQAATNVEGTRAIVELSIALGATLHHISSIAVAGDWAGDFDETSFDVGQGFPTPYHRTKYQAERLVRSAEGLRWRVYRPAVIVGDSTTGEIDKVDGPYYLFGLFALLGHLPAAVPMLTPDIGATNIVPVDYVSAAIVELIGRTADDPDNHTFHLVAPRPQSMREIYNAFADAAGAPRAVATLPAALVDPVLRPSIGAIRSLRDAALSTLRIPPAVVDNLAIPTRFVNEHTRAALGDAGPIVPEPSSYAAVLWRYWRDHLDHVRPHRDSGPTALADRHILITGASSGIGRSTALSVAAKGAVALVIARRRAELDEVVAEIVAAGGRARGYVCDITDDDQVRETIARVLADNGHVDMVVNNAGRSIRRSIHRSTDRMHDFERTMAVNYFGAVRIVLALLPHMRARGFGHIVNVSTASVQGSTPRFSGYVASKAALDGFTDVVAAETLHDGITFTTVHMPLVATPMIAPTGNLNAGPVATPEWAAAMVVRGLIERPQRIDDPLGTLGEWGSVFAPGLKTRLLSRFNRLYPDSAAARGARPDTSVPASPIGEPASSATSTGAADDPSTPTQSEPPRSTPNRSTPVDALLRVATPWAMPKPVRRLGRLLPGTHW